MNKIELMNELSKLLETSYSIDVELADSLDQNTNLFNSYELVEIHNAIVVLDQYKQLLEERLNEGKEVNEYLDDTWTGKDSQSRSEDLLNVIKRG